MILRYLVKQGSVYFVVASSNIVILNFYDVRVLLSKGPVVVRDHAAVAKTGGVQLVQTKAFLLKRTHTAADVVEKTSRHHVLNVGFEVLLLDWVNDAVHFEYGFFHEINIFVDVVSAFLN